MEKGKIIVASVAALTYLITMGNPSHLGFTSSSPRWTHLTYPFVHVSVIHLAVNLTALLALWNGRHMNRFLLLALAYLAAVSSSLFFMKDIPTLGMSGIVFGMVGLKYATAITERNTLYAAVMLAAGCIPVGMNITVHMLSFLFGFTFGLITAAFHTLRHEYR